MCSLPSIFSSNSQRTENSKEEDERDQKDVVARPKRARELQTTTQTPTEGTGIPKLHLIETLASPWNPPKKSKRRTDVLP
jgi:hypothetical protein